MGYILVCKTLKYFALNQFSHEQHELNLGNLGSELRDHGEHNVDTPGTLGLAVACILELLDDWSGVEGPGVCLELDAHLVVHPALPGLLGAGGAVHAHERRDIVVPHHGMVQHDVCAVHQHVVELDHLVLRHLVPHALGGHQEAAQGVAVRQATPHHAQATAAGGRVGEVVGGRGEHTAGGATSSPPPSPPAPASPPGPGAPHSAPG